jgi:GT2 family glycosyltransferase
MSKKAAIVIVNWDGLKWLKDCLDAVYNQSYTNFDVYFVDNGSVDDSIDFVERNFPQAKIIKLEKNTGFTGGNNIGIKKALEDAIVDYIVLLNNDTKVYPNWLLGLVSTAEKEEKIGMVSSLSLFPSKTIQTIGLSLEKNFMHSKVGGISLGCGYSPEDFPEELEIFAPSGVSALYKREVLEKTGLFDDLFFAYAEDLDLGLRARLFGWKALYCPDSKLIHYHSQTAGAGSPFKAFHVKRNSYFVAIKNLCLVDLLLFPFREFFWNLSQLKNMTHNNKSVESLASKIGKWGGIKLMMNVYFQVLLKTPKMFKERRSIQKSKSITCQELSGMFERFSRDNIEKGIKPKTLV